MGCPNCHPFRCTGTCELPDNHDEERGDLMSTIELRFYAHGDQRARVEGSDAVVEAHGWDVCAGETIEVDGVRYTLTRCYDIVQTGDLRGNYVCAEAVRS